MSLFSLPFLLFGFLLFICFFWIGNPVSDDRERSEGRARNFLFLVFLVPWDSCRVFSICLILVLFLVYPSPRL